MGGGGEAVDLFPICINYRYRRHNCFRLHKARNMKYLVILLKFTLFGWIPYLGHTLKSCFLPIFDLNTSRLTVINNLHMFRFIYSLTVVLTFS